MQPSGVLRPRPGGGAGGAIQVVELMRVTGVLTSPRRLTGFIQGLDESGNQIDVGSVLTVFTYTHSPATSGAGWNFHFWQPPAGSRILIGWLPELQQWYWLQWVIGRQNTFPGPC